MPYPFVFPIKFIEFTRTLTLTRRHQRLHAIASRMVRNHAISCGRARYHTIKSRVRGGG